MMPRGWRPAAGGLAAVLAAALATASCQSDNRIVDDTGDMDTETGTDTESDTGADTDTTDNAGCGMMDILFVIDDSESMGCEQELLAQAFPEFISVLQQYSNSYADEVAYRIGVTTTGKTVQFTYDLPDPMPDLPMSEMGENGALQGYGGDKWLDGPGDPFGESTWFSNAALVGTDGSTYEMPLECMRLALVEDRPGGANEGFLRDNALFVAVIITDEDDCSKAQDGFVVPDDKCTVPEEDEGLVDLQDYVDYLDDRFGGPSRYVIVTIASQDGCDSDAYPMTCTQDSGSYSGANAAIRLYEFMADHIGTGDGENGVFSDICNSVMSEALEEALEKMEVACDEYVIE